MQRSMQSTTGRTTQRCALRPPRRFSVRPAAWLGVGVAVISLAGGCGSGDFESGGGTQVRRTTLLWLRNPDDASAREEVLASVDRLADAPGVVQVTAGEPVDNDRSLPAPGGPRRPATTGPAGGNGELAGFDVALTILLTDAKGVEAFEQSPAWAYWNNTLRGRVAERTESFDQTLTRVGQGREVDVNRNERRREAQTRIRDTVDRR